MIGFLALLLMTAFPQTGQQQATTPALKDVKAIEILPTTIPNPDKVKETTAPGIVENNLRHAILLAGFEVGKDAPIKARLILEEFNPGNTATRVIVGMGAGRSTITAILVLQDAGGKEIKTAKIHVRGDILMGSYQGNSTQQKKAVSKFEQALTEELEKMK